MSNTHSEACHWQFFTDGL